MSFYVYVIKSSKSGKQYVGSTRDLDKRLKEHNSGKSYWTRNKGPWELVYCEDKLTASEAERREKFFKTGDGR
ncbi:MAG: hypothetical protein A3D92_25055 [Bacteroidetes bacterium RIFCSPHIGHO2_02_FULL_44_7]|nr:MAG: hypothetical protein A3D92_25055 [Bacteroidetes bacterium RIFCSPHIGHO2_02_FULL_44_7]